VGGFLLVILGISLVTAIVSLAIIIVKKISPLAITIGDVIAIKTSNIKETINCPYCYELHHITDCGLKCSYKSTGNTCADSIIRDSAGWIPPSSRIHCLNCKKTTKHLYCLNTGKEIPIDLLSMKSMKIALLGAKASGKSNYIGVLINEIRKEMTVPFNCQLTITASHETMQAYEKLYYRPIYIEKHPVMATAGGETPPPLIFPLRFMDGKKNIVNKAALTFYDTAGENLDDTNVINKFNSYILNANGIIMLLDPLQVPKFRDELESKGFNDLPEQNTEIYNILSIIIDVMRNTKNIKGQINIPLALVFTKIDVLEQYNILPPDSCLRDESEHIKYGLFVKRDFQITDNHIQDLLDRWLDGELSGFINMFKKHSFFGVSSFGENPVNNKLRKNICPRRVLDPLLWLLAENGYIKTLNM